MTQSSKQVHYIRLELPPDATEEERDKLWKAVTELAEEHSEEFDYDIFVSGGAWYPPEDEEPTTPYALARRNIRKLLFDQVASNSPTDAAVMHAVLQELHRLGMSQFDLQIHLECLRAVNDAVLRNMTAEQNLLAALDMVSGHTDSPQMRVEFQAGTT